MFLSFLNRNLFHHLDILLLGLFGGHGGSMVVEVVIMTSGLGVEATEAEFSGLQTTRLIFLLPVRATV